MSEEGKTRWTWKRWVLLGVGLILALLVWGYIYGNVLTEVRVG